MLTSPRISVIALAGALVFAPSSAMVGTHFEAIASRLPASSAQVEKDDGNVKVTTRSGKVAVGDSAKFTVYAGFQGKARTYTNAQLKITLPQNIDGESIAFTQSMKDIAIRGVEPSYDGGAKVLTYVFPTFVGGFDSSVNIEIASRNGAPLDGVKLPVSATLSADGVPASTSDSSTVLKATASAGLTNKLLGIMKNGEVDKRATIRQGDSAVFEIGISSAKNRSGSIDVLPNGQAELTYTLADGLTYVGDSSGIAPVVNGQTVTWTFPNSTGNDSEYYLAKKFALTARVADDVALFSWISNTAEATVSFVDGTSLPLSAAARVMISPNLEMTLPPTIGGNVNLPGLSGPTDNLGMPGESATNFDPTVTEGALLGWAVYPTTGFATSPKQKMQSSDWFFLPDGNQTLEYFYSGEIYFYPSGDYHNSWIPMDPKPSYSMSIRYADSPVWEPALAEIEQSRQYSAAELGIDSQRKLTGIWLHFYSGADNAFVSQLDETVGGPGVLTPGILSPSIYFYTSPVEGYVGTVRSSAAYHLQGSDVWNQNVRSTSANVPTELLPNGVSSFDVNDYLNRYLFDKTAEVVQPDEGVQRIVRGRIGLENQTDGLVESGDNNLVISLTNDIASLRGLTGPFTQYALIDEGITVKEFEDSANVTVSLVTDNFNGSGKSLLKIVYHVPQVSNGLEVGVVIPVSIAPDAPYVLGGTLFGFVNEDFEVPTTSNLDGTFTEKVQDYLDLNKDGNFTESIYRVKQTYTYVTPYEYYGDIRGSDKVGKPTTFAEVSPNGQVTVNLSLTSATATPFATVALIAVLPRVGDTQVLTDVERSSKFNARLAGPIDLPASMAGKFTVLYSTSSEPEVAGVLDKHTSADRAMLTPASLVDPAPWVEAGDVKSFAEIRSFMLVKTSDSATVKDQNLVVPVKLQVESGSLTGAEPVADRTAFMSFAVGANDAQVFETRNFPITVTKNVPVNPVKPVDPKPLPKTGASNAPLIGVLGVLLVGSGVLLIRRRKLSE